MEENNPILIWSIIPDSLKKADNVAYLVVNGVQYKKLQLIRDAKVEARRALELKEFLLLTNYQINKLNNIIEYGENS